MPCSGSAGYRRLTQGMESSYTSIDECDTQFLQVNKHIAKEDGVPIFGALWTCMTSHYIHSQALTVTKAHEERIGPLTGIAKSAHQFGYNGPAVVFSDDPIKVKMSFIFIAI